MKQQTAEQLWQTFRTSGAIADYLAYKRAISEETSDEIFHQRIDHSGTSRGGVGPTGDGTDP